MMLVSLTGKEVGTLYERGTLTEDVQALLKVHFHLLKDFNSNNFRIDFQGDVITIRTLEGGATRAARQIIEKELAIWGVKPQFKSQECDTNLEFYTKPIKQGSKNYGNHSSI